MSKRTKSILKVCWVVFMIVMLLVLFTATEPNI